jgi:anti-sigma factor RsiW
MKPSTSLPAHDLERLSAFLDGQLSDSDRRVLLARLQHEAALARALEELRRVRGALRALSPVRLPRNFTLTAEMAGRTRPRASRGFAFAWGSALATLALAIVAVTDLAGGGLMAARVAAPAMPAAELQMAPGLVAAPTGPEPRAATDNQADQTTPGESAALSGTLAGSDSTTETAGAALFAQEKFSGAAATPAPAEASRLGPPSSPMPTSTAEGEALLTLGGGAGSSTPPPPAAEPPRELTAPTAVSVAPAFISPLRLIEAGLAVLALALAVAALRARRVRR